MEISHDSVNRFLLREDYTPRDLFQEVRADLNLKGGTVSASYRDWETDRKSTRLNSSHSAKSRMPSSA